MLVMWLFTQLILWAMQRDGKLSYLSYMTEKDSVICFHFSKLKSFT